MRSTHFTFEALSILCRQFTSSSSRIFFLAFVTRCVRNAIWQMGCRECVADAIWESGGTDVLKTTRYRNHSENKAFPIFFYLSFLSFLFVARRLPSNIIWSEQIFRAARRRLFHSIKVLSSVICQDVGRMRTNTRQWGENPHTHTQQSAVGRMQTHKIINNNPT